MSDQLIYKAAIFDMDGTILDTIQDLVNAINYSMAEHGHRHDFTKADGCLMFGSGVYTAVHRALALEAGMDRSAITEIGGDVNGPVPGIDEEEALRIIATYMPYYKAHNAECTCPYPGIAELIKKLKAAGVRTAVVSNKPDNSVVQLAEDYFGGEFDLAVGETPDVARKPAPDMNFMILEKLGIGVKDAVYIGDTEIDLATSRNTGMDCIMVDWGFRSRPYLEACGAEVIVSSADEIYGLIAGGSEQ